MFDQDPSSPAEHEPVNTQPPILIINFKVYEETLAERTLALARIIESCAKQIKHVQIAIAPPLTTTALVAKTVKLPVFAQHVDAFSPGSNTGFVTPEELKREGCTGTLMNHSEHPIALKLIQTSVQRCREAGLSTVVCTPNTKHAKHVARFSPTYIAYEPPELVGGAVSVTTAKPSLIETVVREVNEISPRTQVLCGAGVKSSQDVQAALNLGTRGVLVASGIVKAQDPAQMIQQLLSGFR